MGTYELSRQGTSSIRASCSPSRPPRPTFTSAAAGRLRVRTRMVSADSVLTGYRKCRRRTSGTNARQLVHRGRDAVEAGGRCLHVSALGAPRNNEEVLTHFTPRERLRSGHRASRPGRPTLTRAAGWLKGTYGHHVEPGPHADEVCEVHRYVGHSSQPICGRIEASPMPSSQSTYGPA